jgi:trimethylamine:corrinoid methyltransferase-like protein
VPGGSVEAGLVMMIATGLARGYGLPVSLPGLSATATHLGPLAGWEGSGQGALAVLAGADEVQGMGLLAGGREISPGKLVHDAEQARQLARLARGVRADDEYLLAGAIARVGPHGHYLLEPETRRMMRAEVTPRQLRDERSPDEWLAGGRDEQSRLAAAAARLMAGHPPPPWPAGAGAAVKAILAAADAQVSAEETGS